MSEQPQGATHINDIDDLDKNQLIEELDDMINNESETEELTNPVKVKESSKLSKLNKNAIEVLILFVLLISIGNKYTIYYLFKIPFLTKYQDNSLVPIIVISSIVCFLFFCLKFFMK